MQRNNPVFFDPFGKRGFALHCTIWGASVLILIGLATLIASIVTRPDLPPMPVRGEQVQLSPVQNVAKSLADAPFRIDSNRPRSFDARARQTTRYAFFASWDDNAFLSLRNHAKHLDVLLPEWLHAVGDQGAVRQDDSIREAQTRLWLRKYADHLEIIPVLNNYDVDGRVWDGAAMGRLLADPDRRFALIANVRNYVLKARYQGIAVDFKNLPDTAIPAFTAFVGQLHRELAAEGKSVLVVVPAYETRFDLPALAKASDKIVKLLYDQTWLGTRSGPPAGQGWFEEQLRRTAAQVPAEKLVVTVASYAAEWPDNGPVHHISVASAWDLLAQSGSTLTFDAASLNARFDYKTEAQVSHTVWLLDGVTVFNQVAAALGVAPAGLALWRLGLEDPSAWTTFARGKIPDATTVRELAVIEAGREIRFTGEGEVLSAHGRNQPGEREIFYAAEHNLITGQTIKSLPKSLTIARWGHNSGKKLALTFDDGPSEAYTTEILRILREKNIKATFFVVGLAAALEGKLLRRIYEEGHDIGNHTFTHPNLSNANDIQIDLELNATQRVLEAKLVVGTRLFRPPFNKDTQPATRDQARTLVGSSALGYITIGLKIDPLDWANPGADVIAQRTIEYAESGRGNIILLHDGGGERSQTVEALPRIIDELQARGFSFVPVHELLGMSRDEVMPSLRNTSPAVAAINQLSFSATSLFVQFLNFVFVTAIVLGGLRVSLVAVAAIVQARRVRARADHTWSPPSVAILVPAYNEEAVIRDCIARLLECRGENAMIVVVDDGSTDRTYEVARAAYGDHPRVRVYRKPNGGKASALNFALAQTDAEIVVAIDADTHLRVEAVPLLVRHFSDARIGAVAGSVLVGNDTAMMTRFQWLEYVISQNLDRRALEVAGGITVVPGAIGAWRRSALVEVGGYDEDTLAEDADVTIKLQRAGWQVIYEPAAIADTEAPQTVRLFLRQRFRWMFGMLQVCYKHLGVFRQAGVPGLKYVALPNLVLFQFLFALISPILDLVVIGHLARDAWALASGGAAQPSANSVAVMAYWMLWQAVELGLAALAFRLDGSRFPWSRLPLLILQRFCYRQLIYYVAIRSLYAAIKGRLVGWDKLPRNGLAKAQPAAAPVAVANYKVATLALQSSNQLARVA